MKISFELNDDRIGYNTRFLCDLGRKLEYGVDCVQDYDLAFLCYKTAADLGDDDGLNCTGGMYLNGFGVPKDVSLAIEYFLRAEEAGNITAMINLGNIYENGEDNIDIDYTKALAWYKKAMENGDSTGKFNYANMLHWGWGVKQDRETAYRHFFELCVEGHPGANFYMGLYHELGEVVEQDYGLALYYYEEGATFEEDAYCNVQLGVMYAKGLGVEKDIDKAIQYYKTAAELGDSLAYSNLAYLYETGEGVEQDIVEAIRLYRIAAEDGEKHALEALERIMRE